MEQNCHPNQWFQDNPFVPSRSVFEYGKVEPERDEDPEGVAETLADEEVKTLVSEKVQTAFDTEGTSRTIPTDSMPTAAQQKWIDAVYSANTAEIPSDTTPAETNAVQQLREEMFRLIGENAVLEAAERDRLKSAHAKELAAKDEEIAELKKLVIYDELTSLKTKKYFEENIYKESAEAIRHGKSFGLIFVDLDKFKAINDELGHLAGDAALRIVGQIINNNFRTEDKKCRYGGEELVIILPETNKNQAAMAAEKLRAAIEKELKPGLLEYLNGEKGGEKGLTEAEIAHMVDQQMCTASIGVSSYEDSQNRNQQDPKTIASIVTLEADRAMYKAKEEGRNQVRVHGEEVITHELHEKAVDAITEKRSLDKYVEQMRQSAEKAIPEADMQEKALREAANQMGKKTSA